MPAFIDLTNQQFGRLTVLHRNFENAVPGKVRWTCRCSCPAQTITVVASGNLISGNSQSCGCLQKEEVLKSITKHGLRYTPEYKIWIGVRQRCYNPKNQDYADYGGRGITMCDEWKDSFEAFYQDMGPRPTPQHTIERQENNSGYNKENCRWATREEQASNKRSNILYTKNGETKSLPEWCRDLNIDYRKTYNRIHYMGWSFEEAILPIEYLSITFEGETKTLQDWCELLGLRAGTVARRIYRGESFEDIVKE